MGLVYKKLEKIGRSMYLYFPEQERRTAFKRCSITILRDGEDEASVRYFLDELGMQKLAEEQEIILSFPNPENGRWNYGKCEIVMRISSMKNCFLKYKRYLC